MKRMLLSILVYTLLSSCVTTREKSDLKSNCPDVPEWPSDLTPPKVIKREASLPADKFGVARACLVVQIDEAGNVTEVQVSRTDFSDFASASATAVRRWRFEPARKGSTPVAATYHLYVESVRSPGSPPKELLERTGGRTRSAEEKDEVLVFNAYRTGGEAPPRALDGCDFLGTVSATVPEVQGHSVGYFNPTALLPIITARAARKSADTVVVSFYPGFSGSGSNTLRGTAFRCGNHPLPPELGEPLR